jgi:hypothetical protein
MVVYFNHPEFLSPMGATYLDRMSDLLFTEHLATSQPGDEVRQVARARTLTLLPQLNGTRKSEVMQFLYEAGLIGDRSVSAIVDLSNANLSNANLIGANLSDANLRGALQPHFLK